MSYKFTSDYGDSIVFNGKALRKIGTIQDLPNATIGGQDQINIGGFAWAYDDNNVSGGTEHTVWTPYEMAISNIPLFYRGALVVSNVETEVMYAPTDGILRIYFNSEYGVNLSVLKNGAVVASGRAPFPQSNAMVVKVLAGERITAQVQSGSAVCTVRFLPYRYRYSYRYINVQTQQPVISNSFFGNACQINNNQALSLDTMLLGSDGNYEPQTLNISVTSRDIVEKTWNYDDSNVQGGSNHRTWTPSEMALCTLPSNMKHLEQTSDMMISGAKYLTMNVSGPGKCKFYYKELVSGKNMIIYHNGVQLLSIGQTSLEDAQTVDIPSAGEIYISPSGAIPAWTSPKVGYYFLPTV